MARSLATATTARVARRPDKTVHRSQGHRTVSTQWHDTLHLPLRIAGPSRITTFAYDAHGNLASKSEQPTLDLTGARQFNATVAGAPRNSSYTSTYSSAVPGLMTRQVIDGPRTDVGDLTTTVWDASGNLVSITDALGHVTTLGNYDAHGHARTVTDPNGLVTRLSYDPRGRLTALNVGEDYQL